MASPRLLASVAFSISAGAAGCAGEPSDVLVQLAPDIVSSLNGTLAVRATVLADRDPVPEEPLELTVEYFDRNGAAHQIAPLTGATDDHGVFETTLSGFNWDGNGTITLTGSGIEGSASFAVLDRTPPKVTITPPPANTVRRGTDITVRVHVTDEIGVSQVYFGTTERSRDRSLIASGAGDIDLDFDFQVPDIAPGATIGLFALAEDLSGNQGAATPSVVTVVP